MNSEPALEGIEMMNVEQTTPWNTAISGRPLSEYIRILLRS